jgi:hypothetical protein
LIRFVAPEGAMLQEAGIDGEPDVRMFPLHGVYAPVFGREEQTAAPSPQRPTNARRAFSSAR